MQLIEHTVRTAITGSHFVYMGKVDRLENGTLIDWKTATDPRDFMDKNVVGLQAEMYALALKHEGYDVKKVEYRIIQKPKIRYSSKDADIAAYRDRCIEWLQSTPGALLTETVHITKEKLYQATQKIAATAHEINQSTFNNYWRQNENACKDYGRACPFIPLCKGADLSGYEVKEQRHAELGENAANVLTYTAIKCYNQCARRYLYQYVEGLQRKNEESAEALQIGSLVHLALEKPERDPVEVVETESADYFTVGDQEQKKQDQIIAQAQAMAICAKQKWSV